MTYKLVTKKREQYILYVLDRYKGVVKIMDPEETTFKKLEDKIRDQAVKDVDALEEQVQGKKKSKNKKEEEEEQEEEVTDYLTRNMVITSFT